VVPTVAKAEYNAKARFATAPTQQQNEVHYDEVFVVVSRCSILTPAGLQISFAKPDVPQWERGFEGNRK